MTQNPTIKLPAERIDQLKALQEALNLRSIADTVGYLIRAEIKRGTIPDTIPGIVVTADGEKVSIAFDGETPVVRSRINAIYLAEALHAAATDGSGLVSIGGDFGVVKQGNGIKVTLPLAGKGKILSRDLARDLSRQIMQATG